MTEWEKLFEKINWESFLQEINVKWLEQVKTVGDDLLAENQKLREELNRYQNTFHLIKLVGGNEVQLAERLEAIREIAEKHWDSSETISTAQNGLYKIREVLGG